MYTAAAFIVFIDMGSFHYFQSNICCSMQAFKPIILRFSSSFWLVNKT
uniref:Uncharacterized protein n=1 Tax=Rhizophora mucronata TaxID=61149 RepID=A0A2P2J2T6_RHIMU